MLAPSSTVDDGKMPGADGWNDAEMTVGQLKTHVDQRFKQVDRRFDELRVLSESVRDDVRKVAEGLAANTNAVDRFLRDIAADRARFEGRLDNHEARITILESRKRRRGA
jgi:septal ring factor EnvC (AmiA/AmiB activator)